MQPGDNMAQTIAEIVRGVQERPLEDLSQHDRTEVEKLIDTVPMKVPTITIEQPSVRRQMPDRVEVIRMPSQARGPVSVHIPEVCIPSSPVVPVVSTLFKRREESEPAKEPKKEEPLPREKPCPANDWTSVSNITVSNAREEDAPMNSIFAGLHKAQQDASQLHNENRQKVEGWYKDRLHRERAVWTQKNESLMETLNAVIEEKVELEAQLLESQRKLDTTYTYTPCSQCAEGVAEVNVLTKRTAHLEEERTQNLARLDTTREQNTHLTALLDQEKRRSADLDAKHTAAISNMAAAEAQLQAVLVESQAPCKQCASGVQELASLSKRIIALEEERAQQLARLDTIREQNTHLTAQCDQERARTAEQDDKLHSSVAAASTFERQFQTSQRQQQRLSDEKKVCPCNTTHIRQELLHELEGLRSQVARLETQAMEIAAKRKEENSATEDVSKEIQRLKIETEKSKAWAEQLEECEKEATVKLTRATNELKETENKHEVQVRRLNTQITELKSALDKALREGAEGNVLKARIEKAEREVKAAKVRYEELDEKYQHVMEKYSVHGDAVGVLDDVTNRYMQERALRRKYYNQLVMLKGNIRVVCRVRPTASVETIPYVVENEAMGVTLKNGKQRGFKFDSIFPQNSTQEQVYGTAEDMTQSLLDGYNVCIMAYGQTGSGKTYTMFGDEKFMVDEEVRGIVPRILKGFWSAATVLPNTVFTASLSMVEIYCGEVRDLLTDAPHTNPSTETAKYMMGSEVITHKMVPVGSLQECFELITAGYRHRTQAATLCNERSSRSHCLVTLHYKSKLKGEGLEKTGEISSRMVLADLGGSECVTTAGLGGVQVRECSHINKSLSALSDVLGALSAGRSHIPYRNSKLTHILSDCLGGDAKMLLCVNMNPSKAHATETLHTLSFGHRARQIKRGPAARHFVAERSQSPIRSDFPEAP